MNHELDGSLADTVCGFTLIRNSGGGIIWQSEKCLIQHFSPALSIHLRCDTHSSVTLWMSCYTVMCQVVFTCRSGKIDVIQRFSKYPV